MFDTASAAAFFKHFLDPIEIIVRGLNEAGSYKFPFFVFFNQNGRGSKTNMLSLKET